MTPRVEPAGPPDPRWDPYRRADARVYDGLRIAGSLSLRVEFWWTRSGRWRSAWVDPKERLEWLLAFAPDYDHGHPDGYDDGEFRDLEEAERELGQDTFVYKGRPLRLEWLAGEEARESRETTGWDADD